MNIEKGKLETLYRTLDGTSGNLSLAESRTRDAAMKPLTELVIAFEAERRTVYEKFCEKDADGKPVVADNQYKFPPEVLPELTAELDTLYAETVELRVLMPGALRDVLERTLYKPKIGEVEVIDSLLSLLAPADA